MDARSVHAVKQVSAGKMLVTLCIMAACGWMIAMTWVAVYGSRKPPERADAAVVLGAAVWRGGRPSPVLVQRTQTSLALYRTQRVRWIMTTGGQGQWSPTESEAARALLLQAGVPSEVILSEATSHNTVENLANLTELAKSHGIRTIFVVSNGYHLSRAVWIAQDNGFRAWGVASDGSAWRSLWRNPKRWFGETVLSLAYLLQRLKLRAHAEE